jgi:uncharacterized repeat protein (TIGR04042 family)
MPAMCYRLVWPDRSESDCYSPSLVVKDYLAVGASYPMPEFLRRVRLITAIASERVRAKFGYACSRAQDQLEQIEQEAVRFAQQPDAQITVVSFEEDVP